MANLRIIKDLAKAKKIPMEELAREVGITPQALSKLMRSNVTRLETVERIAMILGVSPTIFFADDTHSLSVGNTTVNGNQNRLNDQTDRFLSLLAKKDEQMDRLITLLEKCKE